MKLFIFANYLNTWNVNMFPQPLLVGQVEMAATRAISVVWTLLSLNARIWGLSPDWKCIQQRLNGPFCQNHSRSRPIKWGLSNTSDMTPLWTLWIAADDATVKFFKRRNDYLDLCDRSVNTNSSSPTSFETKECLLYFSPKLIDSKN